MRTSCSVGFLLLLAGTTRPLFGQATPDPRYQTRQSDCRHDPPPGKALAIRRTDSGITTRGYTAERVLTLTADARMVSGGDIVACSEYGRVEIADSYDNEVRLQVRLEGLGEGSADPRAAAKKVIEETSLHTFITNSSGRLMIRVWHSTLGFTAPGGQPAWVSIRLEVPARGSYRVLTEAFHGNISIHRLTLSSATLRGAVGEKLKGIPGFIGQTELDNVVLAGDVNIDNIGGIPGVRDPVPAQLSGLAAPILVKAHVTSSSRLTAITGGNINIAIQPSPELGVRALGQANEGQVSIRIDGATTENAPSDSSFRTQRSASTSNIDSRPIRMLIRAASIHGAVNIASIPAAPLISHM